MFLYGSEIVGKIILESLNLNYLKCYEQLIYMSELVEVESEIELQQSESENVGDGDERDGGIGNIVGTVLGSICKIGGRQRDESVDTRSNKRIKIGSNSVVENITIIESISSSSNNRGWSDIQKMADDREGNTNKGKESNNTEIERDENTGAQSSSGIYLEGLTTFSRFKTAIYDLYHTVRGRNSGFVHAIIYKPVDPNENYNGALYRKAKETFHCAVKSEVKSFIVGVHNIERFNSNYSHIHWIHGCPKYKLFNQCKCPINKRLTNDGYFIKRKYIRDVNEQQYLTNLTLYLSQSGRELVQARIAGSDRLDEIRQIKNKYITNDEWQGTNHIRCCTADTEGWTRIEADHENIGGDAVDAQSKPKSFKNIKQYEHPTKLGQEITLAILRTLPLDIDHFFYIIENQNKFEALMFNPKEKKEIYNAALSVAQTEWNRKTIWQIFSHIFNVQPSFDVDRTYYDPIISAKLICSIWLKQAQGNISLAREQIKTLFKVLDKNNGKQNTFMIKSPSGAGKTFVMDPLLDCLWNVCHMKAITKGAQFPFNDVKNKKVIIWNEPSIEPGAGEDCLKLFGGERLGANVKYESSTVHKKTPVIITGNRDFRVLFKQELQMAMRSRIYEIEWQALPELIHTTGYPHPLAWYYIYKDIDIDDLFYTPLEWFADEFDEFKGQKTMKSLEVSRFHWNDIELREINNVNEIYLTNTNENVITDTIDWNNITELFE
jgi:hypothetical protein